MPVTPDFDKVPQMRTPREIAPLLNQTFIGGVFTGQCIAILCWAAAVGNAPMIVAATIGGALLTWRTTAIGVQIIDAYYDEQTARFEDGEQSMQGQMIERLYSEN